MSVIHSYYAIAGMDLTGYETEKFKDWKWSDGGESYSYNQAKGEIQLFDDPMSGVYLYLGYIFAAGDEYGFNTEKIDPSSIESHKQQVIEELKRLVKMGVISSKALKDTKYELIIFEDCR